MSETEPARYVLRADEGTAARLLEAFGFPQEDYEADEWPEMVADMTAAIAAVVEPMADPSTGVEA